MQSSSSAVSSGCDDRNEISGSQTCAADESAVNVVDGEDFGSVRRLHGAAVENANLVAGGPETFAQLLPDRSVHDGNVRHRWDHAGADRPDRLVGDGEFRLSFEACGQGLVELGGDNFDRAPLFANL